MSGDIQQEGNQTFHYGYKIKVFGLKEGDKKLQWDKDLLNHQKSVTVENIITSATTYTVSIARWSRTTAPSIIQGDLMGHGPLDALSNFEEKTVITPPPPPLNLRQEQLQVGSLKVKWDSPTSVPQTGKLGFSISIHPLSSELKTVMKEDWKEVESNVYQFSQLPELVGSGEKYRVSVQSVFTSSSGQTSRSQPVTEIFLTKPLPPRDLRVLDDDQQIISWQRSLSPSVRLYKVKIRKETEKAMDYIHEVEENQPDCKFQLPALDLMVEYKLNIYSVLMHNEVTVESEPLFYKIKKEDYCSLSTETSSQSSDLTDAVRLVKLHLLRKERDQFGGGAGLEPGGGAGGPGFLSRQTSIEPAYNRQDILPPRASVQ